MLLYPQTQEIYPIGSVIEATQPPSNKWVKCYGQIVLQADYPLLYSILDNPHPNRWNNLIFDNEYFNYLSLSILLKLGSTYIAAGTNSKIYYATNLFPSTEWALATSPTGNWLNGCSNGTICLLVGDTGTAAATSTDGINWTLRTLSASKYWKYSCWDGTYFYVGATNYNKLTRSTDGASWSEIDTVTPSTSGYVGYKGIASDGAGTIVVLHNSGMLGTSSDSGATWTVQTSNNYNGGIFYVNGKFIILLDNGILKISEDGINWDWVQMFCSGDYDDMFYYYSAYSGGFHYVVYDNGMYLFFDPSSSMGYLMYSYDLINFYPIFKPLGSDYSWVSGVWDSSNSLWFVISGEGSTIRISEFNYNSATHFQFPIVAGGHRQETGRHWYIRVR